MQNSTYNMELLSHREVCKYSAKMHSTCRINIVNLENEPAVKPQSVEIQQEPLAMAITTVTKGLAIGTAEV